MRIHVAGAMRAAGRRYLPWATRAGWGAVARPMCTPRGVVAGDEGRFAAQEAVAVLEEGAAPKEDESAEWVEQVDLSSGRRYYYRRDTLEFRITKPEKGNVEQGRVAMYAVTEEERKRAEALDDEVGWRVYIDPASGRPFYYHSGTHETRWDNPLGLTISEADYAGALKRVPDEALHPAPFAKRALAGVIDGCVAVAVGAAAGGIVWWELEQPVLGSFGAAYAAVLALITKDSIFEQGTRSLGKRIAGLEIVRTNGEVPSRYRTFTRNSYLLSTIASVELFPFLQILQALDAAACAFGPRRRLGDYLGGTAVIEEQPDRADRLQDYKEFWLKKDTDTDWRKMPNDVADAMERAKRRRAAERTLREQSVPAGQQRQ